MRRSLLLGTIVLLGLALGGCAWLFTPLKAVLTVTPGSGTAPLSVTFSAAGSTGAIAAFTLDFETDGTVDYTGTDITVAVNHTYTTPGTYTATLTVQDNRGRTDSDSVTVTVLPGTTASLSASPNPVTQGADVTFILQATAASGRELTAWKLWFAYAAGADPDEQGGISGPTFYRTLTRSYGTAGTHTARLEVTDSASQTVVKTLQITVTSPPPEITAFTIEGSDVEPVDVLVATDVTFAFQAQAGDASRKLVKWELRSGDGYVVTVNVPPSSTLNVTHVYLGGYTQTGSYTASVKVWDDLTPPNTDEATLQVEVTAGP